MAVPDPASRPARALGSGCANRESAVNVIRGIGLFAAAGLAEIGGGHPTGQRMA